MASPTTTHVIEIETGIGEPAFIPLSMGQELQPISVGKKGMWRIDSSRVLDVHAFVYFDGNSLFLQSADEANAASVDGFRVGKAWTELHAPCKIGIGQARLRFRSLTDQPAATAPAGGSRPGASQPAAAPPPSKPPMTFPKADRPFKGESSPPQPSRPAPSAPKAQAGGSVPPGYGSMTPHGVQKPRARGASQGLVAKLKRNAIPLIVSGGLLLIGGIVVLARHNDPAKGRPVVTPDGGNTTTATGPSALATITPQPTVPPAWPAGVACPPPNWPPNTPLPCTPSSASQPVDPPGKPRTLERQAVDLVAAGETAKAAAAYEEIVRREPNKPNNKVYAEAARILRAKLDAGGP